MFHMERNRDKETSFKSLLGCLKNSNTHKIENQELFQNYVTNFVGLQNQKNATMSKKQIADQFRFDPNIREMLVTK